MVVLDTIDKYYTVMFEALIYNVYIQGNNYTVDEVAVFEKGNNISDTKKGKEVLEYFYDNLESE